MAASMKPLPEHKLRVAVIGAGPVGLALALLAARQLPSAQVTLFDARPAERDVAADPRTLALSLGSIQLLQRLEAWDGTQAEPIREVWVSQQSPVLAVPGWLGQPQVRLSAIDLAVPMLGAVLRYGALVAPMQQAWEAVAAREPARLTSRFGTPVQALKDVAGGVEVDAGVAETFDVACAATTTRMPGSAPSRSPAAAPASRWSASRDTGRQRCCPCMAGHSRRWSGACHAATTLCAISTRHNASRF
jgi:hypothetical protein